MKGNGSANEGKTRSPAVALGSREQHQKQNKKNNPCPRIQSRVIEPGIIFLKQAPILIICISVRARWAHREEQLAVVAAVVVAPMCARAAKLNGRTLPEITALCRL